MPDAHMTESIPVANPVVIPETVTPPRGNIQTAHVVVTPPPVVHVRHRQELLVKKGIYKGKRGYLDETRGNRGYSPSRKSVFITYLDENGVERQATNYIRADSVNLVQWSTPVVNNNPILQRHPEVSLHLAELAPMLAAIQVQNLAEARQLRDDLLVLMNSILMNIRMPAAE